MLTLAAQRRVAELHRIYGDNGRHQFGGAEPKHPPVKRQDAEPRPGTPVFGWIEAEGRFGHYIVGEEK
ncbi:MAG: hypothetical protein QF858_00935 [Candidatus Pacebacteria bacterium]|jgi:hypothetical protein|nr:hypothetical protein [bacterium]MDP6527431.1 hypothetical protein [Candidatus Paceibacterota bacterium]|tara:strand:+ start:3038 stop:3241 length:204 start_codon:yes stop_codon:yes gene_type:complete